MWFGVLGPVAVVPDNGEPEVVLAPRLRVVLAVLLAEVNHPVSVDALADQIWDGAPPSGAATTVRNYVLRLRRALGSQGSARVLTQAPGYLLCAAEAEVDALAFEALCHQAGAAVEAGDWPRATAAAARALELWRGTPLADVPCQPLRDRWVPHLEQMQVQVHEWRCRAESYMGHHELLIPQLRELTARHPLREGFHALLVLALARTGRQADALAAYQDARQVLVGELGVEPGPELRDLHQRILAGDAGLLLPAATGSVAAAWPDAPVPRQLPASVRHFTGRQAELDALGRLVQTPDDAAAGETVVISAIDGTAGIGKTALAVHWAHLVAPLFPDGQLYVNLRGFDPSGVPMAAAEATRRFLTALGVPARRIPVDLDEQAALYRSELAGRRILVLLDNARDVEQVRPLLPGAAGCLVVVTSRNRLSSLVAIDGAVPLRLDLLTERDARELLIRRLGSERVRAEEHAASELIGLCARLPLALNIAAARAALDPARRLSELAGEMRGARGRLDALTAGDGTAADIRAVFSWSYRTLAPEAARAFRLLAMHPGPGISLPAAASLTSLDPEHARRILGELSSAHLIGEHSPGRYDFHDLLRAYATDLACAHESENDRQGALRRVCDFYVHAAYAAERLLNPHRTPIRLEPPSPGTQLRELADDGAAVDWFDAEHPNLLAAQQTAAICQWHTTVWELAWVLTTFHRRRGHLHDNLSAWQAAADAAVHLPDLSARIYAHRLLGHAYADLRHHQQATENLLLVLALAERHHDPAQQAHTHHMLARVWDLQGDDRQALHHATIALDLFRRLGEPVRQAEALNTVGWFTARLGDYDEARAHCRAALTLHQRHQDPTGEADTLDSLGYIEHQSGRHHQAIGHYQQALTLFRGLSNTHQAASTLDKLGSAHAALEQHQQARASWLEALELYRRQGRTERAERVEKQLGTLNRP